MKRSTFSLVKNQKIQPTGKNKTKAVMSLWKLNAVLKEVVKMKLLHLIWLVKCKRKEWLEKMRRMYMQWIHSVTVESRVDCACSSGYPQREHNKFSGCSKRVKQKIINHSEKNCLRFWKLQSQLIPLRRLTYRLLL